MVPTKDVAWHAGNWYVNTHSVGIENEGFATAGRAVVHAEALPLARPADALPGAALRASRSIARTSSATTRCRGRRAPYQAGMHWDPGPFFDWARLMALAGAPIRPHGTGNRPDRHDRADVADERADGDGLRRRHRQVPEATGELRLPPHGAELAQPARLRPVSHRGRRRAGRSRYDARLGLGRQGLDRRAVRRRRPAWRLARGLVRRPEGMAARSAREARHHHPGQRHAHHAETGRRARSRSTAPPIPPATRPPRSTSTRSRPGRRTWPRISSRADHYSATTFDDPSSYSVQTSPEKFYEIFFNHRIAYVRADEVDVVR